MDQLLAFDCEYWDVDARRQLWPAERMCEAEREASYTGVQRDDGYFGGVVEDARADTCDSVSVAAYFVPRAVAFLRALRGFIFVVFDNVRRRRAGEQVE